MKDPPFKRVGDNRLSLFIYLHVSLKIEEIDPLPIGPIERQHVPGLAYLGTTA